MKKLPLFGLLLSLTVSLAHAHGDQKHTKKPAEPVKAEQKAFGIAGDPKKATRTVKLDMSDKMRFTPSSLTVKEGETVRFVMTNSGKIMHEMVIGTMKELKEHAEQMKKFPEMEHDEPYMAHVKPGDAGEIAWTFNKPGEFHFACLIPGHFEAGMIGTIKVVGKSGHARNHKEKS